MVDRQAGQGAALAEWIVRHNMLFLAGGVVIIVCLMVLPVSHYFLDTMIAVNIAASIGLLLLSVYIGSPLMLNTFPTLLLFTTLLRLSLNIASSRSILLHANAGHIIDTFGHLVVGGNVLVGLVVFVIISIVQFIVVAKGSERVAEVAARFTLDAMPGKQMSIDADLRAGMIDRDEARRRRSMLEQESQLHGAMDGAMKFVKGDAIAGLLIALVNLLAGLGVGAGMHGMSLGEAIDRYSVLTVGDGMVSQIPSLFVSIAAGVLTTRVSGEESTDLGGEIVRQVLGQPTALLVTGAMLFGFLLVPGFPAPQFLALGLTIGGVGWILFRQARRSRSGRNTPVAAMRGEVGVSAAPALVEERMPALAVPLLVRVSDEVSACLDAKRFGAALERVRKELQEGLGVPFPGVRLVHDPELEAGAYRVLVHEVTLTEARMPDGRRPLLLAPGAAMPADAHEDEALAPMARIAWVAEDATAPDQAEELEFDGLLARYIGWVIATRPHAFVGIQETQRLLQRAESELNDLVKEVLKVMPLQRVTDVLRRLLQERVPIRNLRAIGEAMVTWGAKEKDIVILTELVRVELGRWIAVRHAYRSGKIHAILIHPDTEMQFKNSIQQNAGGSFLALSQEERQRFCDAVKAIVDGEQSALQPSVLVTTLDLRRYLRKLIEPVLPDCAVLSYEEIGEHAGLAVRGTVDLLQGAG